MFTTGKARFAQSFWVDLLSLGSTSLPIPGRCLMHPRFCCFYLNQGLRMGWLSLEGGKRVEVTLVDGSTIRKRFGDLLHTWPGHALSPASRSGGSHVEARAALAQLREAAQPPPKLHKALDLLYEVLSGSRAGESLSFDDLPLKEALASLVDPTVAGVGENPWSRAHLFMALLRDAERFRFARGAFAARMPEDIAAWKARHAAAEERERWANKAEAFRALLEMGKALPGDDPEAEVFPARLFSLLALEKRSPHWELLARPLGLNRLHGEDLALRLKLWLVTAGAWPDWPAVWLARGEVDTNFPTALEDAATVMASSPTLAPATAPARKGARRDFTGLETYSIDSAETRDIDDAFSIMEIDSQGATVALHIAEPDPALLPGHPLFDEAARRMATAYTLAGIYPMFPKTLSENRFSLLAGTPRETLTFIVRVAEGRVVVQDVTRGLVHLSANLDFTRAQVLLDEHPATWGRLALLCAELAEARARRGAMLMARRGWRLDITDPEHIALVPFSRTGPVHQVVEELAIAYNAAAGAYCSRHKLPAIYRVQPHPPGGTLKGGEIGAAGEVMRGPMAPARFTTRPAGHSGLGCDRYIQATSPIRRFPDLVMQRQIAEHAAGGSMAYPDPAPLDAWALAVESRMAALDDTTRRIEEDWKRRYLLQLQRNTRGVSGGHPVLSGVVRRRRDGAARVWLEDLRLSVQCELPDDMDNEAPVRLHIESVDRDRRLVWCSLAR